MKDRCNPNFEMGIWGETCGYLTGIYRKHKICLWLTAVLDSFSAMMKHLPDRCTALAKKELLYAGTFGLAAWLCGIVFVDRINRDRARQTMGKTAQIMHSKNVSRA